MKLFGPSRLGNVLMVAGLLMLLYIPATYALTDLQGVMLQARLRSSGPSDSGIAALAKASATPQSKKAVVATATTAGRAAPISAATPAGAAAASSGTAGKGAVPTATRTALVAAPPSPTAQPTATPTETPSPTPVPFGPPVRILFPQLNIEAGVSHMAWTTVKNKDGSQNSEWLVPENTAGWAVNSAKLGENGNIVIAGHNNIYGQVFRNISLAWPQNGKPEAGNPAVYTSDILNGRVIQLYSANGKRFDYQITAFYRVQDNGISLSQIQQNADYMQATPDPQLTLITCWPPWSNTHRLIVRAKLVQ